MQESLVQREEIKTEEVKKEKPIVICPECGYRHIWKNCPLWKARRRLCTPHYYCLPKLYKIDLAEYAAASMLVIDSDGNMLFALQCRNEENKLNFIGGKREFGESDPKVTARREFLQETSDHSGKSLLHVNALDRLSSCIKDDVLWAGPCKGVIFEFEMEPSELFTTTNTTKSSSLNSEVIDLKWINSIEIVKMIVDHTLTHYFHIFAADILLFLFA
jgi:8-oxo-dGTP pyrophosphatase MutT (NUDIX family)